MAILVVTIKDNVVDEAILYPSPQAAEEAFLTLCARMVPNWDGYKMNEINDLLDNGYADLPNGSIGLVHAEQKA